MELTTVGVHMANSPVMKIDRPVTKDEYLRSLLSAEQLSQLGRVQRALDRDPTCLEQHKQESKDA